MENLLPGEILICLDFAENYAYVIQNSAQSFHWNNTKLYDVTVLIYYKVGEELHASIPYSDQTRRGSVWNGGVELKQKYDDNI